MEFYSTGARLAPRAAVALGGESPGKVCSTDPFTWSLQMNETLEAGVVLVRGSAAGFAQEIIAGRHRLLADEPVADGGTDTGPGPYDLLLAALGA